MKKLFYRIAVLAWVAVPCVCLLSLSTMTASFVLGLLVAMAGRRLFSEKAMTEDREDLGWFWPAAIVLPLFTVLTARGEVEWSRNTYLYYLMTLCVIGIVACAGFLVGFLSKKRTA